MARERKRLNTAQNSGETADNITIFYRAMHYSAKRSLAIPCRLSVCPSVPLSVTLVDQDHID